MKMNFEQVTPRGGDETAGYDVTLDDDYTIGEVIDDILKGTREWGDIHYADVWLEYSHGKLTKGTRNLEKEKIKVNKLRASGGWSRMDYYFN